MSWLMEERLLGFPRMRGGDPELRRAGKYGGEFSPHARG